MLLMTSCFLDNFHLIVDVLLFLQYNKNRNNIVIDMNLSETKADDCYLSVKSKESSIMNISNIKSAIQPFDEQQIAT